MSEHCANVHHASPPCKDFHVPYKLAPEAMEPPWRPLPPPIVHASPFGFNFKILLWPVAPKSPHIPFYFGNDVVVEFPISATGQYVSGFGEEESTQIEILFELVYVTFLTGNVDNLYVLWWSS